jgi:hypothetical protein
MLGAGPAAGLIFPPDVFTANSRELIIKLADQYRVPAVYSIREFTHGGGGLLSYGLDFEVQYVDRILRGEKTGELPVQTPTKFELIVNIKANHLDSVFHRPCSPWLTRSSNKHPLLHLHMTPMAAVGVVQCPL